MSTKELVILIPSEVGGRYQATVSLAHELKKIDSKTKIIHVTDYKTYNSQLKKPFQVYRNAVHNLAVFYIEIKKIANGKNVIIYSPSLLCIAVATCYSFLNQKKWTTVFHYHGWQVGNLSEWLSNSSSWLIKLSYLLPFLLITRLLTFIFLHFCSLVVVPTPYSVKKIQTSYGIAQTKILVCLNGVDHSIFKPAKTKRKPWLIYSGRVSSEKKVELLIQTLQYLASWTLIIATPTKINDFPPSVKTALQKSLLPIRIKLQQSPPQLAKLLQQSTLSLLVSNSSEEQLPLSFLESIACGTPMISSNIGGIYNVQKKIDYQLVLNDVTVNSIVSTVKKYSQKSALQKEKINLLATKIAADFSWQKSAQKMLNRLKKVN